MKKIIANGLKVLREKDQVLTVRSVSGGDINEAYYVRTDKNEYFVKLNRQVKKDFFEFEAEGINIIGDTKTINVPNLIGVVEDEETHVPMLWMEWIEGSKNSETDKLLGERLAALHLCEGEKYGFHRDSYIGGINQRNGLFDSWCTYYREVRLMGQIELGRSKGRITGTRYRKLEKLIESLGEWIPIQPKKSVLHGDLWGGNWMTGQNGTPYLIDPSTLFGDHEFEIAFTELFGGFSQIFYEAYSSVFRLSRDYEERRDIYQLFYLLVHLNLFGEMYGESVDRILKKYVG